MKISYSNYVIILSSFVSIESKFTEGNTADVMEMWKTFKSDYNKSYDVNEEPHRFDIFVENLKRIEGTIFSFCMIYFGSLTPYLHDRAKQN